LDVRAFGDGLLLTSRWDYAEPSVFLAANLLREARRQRKLPDGVVPRVRLLDPDGDMVRYVRETGRATHSPVWACYHTDLWETTIGDVSVGVIGAAVGSPFAVLVAEQCFASGCELLISVASAGQISADLESPCFVLIDRASRGEGTSHAYLPPAPVVDADPEFIDRAADGLRSAGIDVRRGMTWTTDAPYRETQTAIDRAKLAGAAVVEMEAAALYAFGRARNLPIVCFAHVTNQMAQNEGDF